MLKLLNLRYARSAVGTLNSLTRWSTRTLSDDTRMPIDQAIPTAVANKFQIFKDDDSSVILDIDEERLKLSAESEAEEAMPDIYAGLNVQSEFWWVFWFQFLFILNTIFIKGV